MPKEIEGVTYYTQDEVKATGDKARQAGMKAGKDDFMSSEDYKKNQTEFATLKGENFKSKFTNEWTKRGGKEDQMENFMKINDITSDLSLEKANEKLEQAIANDSQKMFFKEDHPLTAEEILAKREEGEKKLPKDTGIDAKIKTKSGKPRAFLRRPKFD